MGKKKKKALREAAAREHDAHAPLRALAATGAMRALAPIAKRPTSRRCWRWGWARSRSARCYGARAGAQRARMVAKSPAGDRAEDRPEGRVDRARPNAAGKAPTLRKGHGTDDSDLNAFP